MADELQGFSTFNPFSVFDNPLVASLAGIERTPQQPNPYRDAPAAQDTTVPSQWDMPAFEQDAGPVGQIWNVVQGAMKGIVQGFTTFQVGDAPDDTAEMIAYQAGSVLGFLGIIPGPGTVAGLAARGSLIAGKGLRATGLMKDSTRFLRNMERVAKRNPISPVRVNIMGQSVVGSVPMLVGEGVVRAARAVKAAKYGETIPGINRAIKAIDDSPIVKDVLDSVLRVGSAGAVANWQQGVEGAVQGGLTGMLIGGVAASASNLATVQRLGPMAQKAFGMELQDMIAKGDVRKANMIMRSIASGVISGGVMNQMDMPMPVQVYAFLEGLLLGKMEVNAHLKQAMRFTEPRFNRAYRGKSKSQGDSMESQMDLYYPERTAEWKTMTDEAKAEVKQQAEELLGQKAVLERADLDAVAAEMGVESDLLSLLEGWTMTETEAVISSGFLRALRRRFGSEADDLIRALYGAEGQVPKRIQDALDEEGQVDTNSAMFHIIHSYAKAAAEQGRDTDGNLFLHEVSTKIAEEAERIRKAEGKIAESVDGDLAMTTESVREADWNTLGEYLATIQDWGLPDLRMARPLIEASVEIHENFPNQSLSGLQTELAQLARGLWTRAQEGELRHDTPETEHIKSGPDTLNLFIQRVQDKYGTLSDKVKQELTQVYVTAGMLDAKRAVVFEGKRGESLNVGTEPTTSPFGENMEMRGYPSELETRIADFLASKVSEDTPHDPRVSVIRHVVREEKRRRKLIPLADWAAEARSAGGRVPDYARNLFRVERMLLQRGMVPIGGRKADDRIYAVDRDDDLWLDGSTPQEFVADRVRAVAQARAEAQVEAEGGDVGLLAREYETELRAEMAALRADYNARLGDKRLEYLHEGQMEEGSWYVEDYPHEPVSRVVPKARIDEMKETGGPVRYNPDRRNRPSRTRQVDEGSWFLVRPRRRVYTKEGKARSAPDETTDYVWMRVNEDDGSVDLRPATSRMPEDAREDVWLTQAAYQMRMWELQAGRPMEAEEFGRVTEAVNRGELSLPKNVADMNKRRQVFLDRNPPPLTHFFRDIPDMVRDAQSGAQTVGILHVNAVPDSPEYRQIANSYERYDNEGVVGRRISETVKDGGLFLRPDVFRAMARAMGVDVEAGFIKASQVGVDAGDGLTRLNKMGLFEADDQMALFLESNGLQGMAYTTATKYQGSTRGVDVTYDGQYRVAAEDLSPHVSRLPVTSFRLNRGSSGRKEGFGETTAALQIHSIMESVRQREGIDLWVDTVVKPAVEGDAGANRLVQDLAGRNATFEEWQTVNWDDVGIQRVLETASGMNGEDAFRALMKQIDREYTPGDVDDFLSREQLMEIRRSLSMQAGGERIVSAWGDGVFGRQNKFTKNMTDAAIHGYVTRRVKKPKLKNSSKAYIAPHDDRFQWDVLTERGIDPMNAGNADPVEPGTYYLSRDHREMPVVVEGETWRLGELWDEVSSLRASDTADPDFSPRTLNKLLEDLEQIGEDPNNYREEPPFHADPEQRTLEEQRAHLAWSMDPMTPEAKTRYQQAERRLLDGLRPVVEELNQRLESADSYEAVQEVMTRYRALVDEFGPDIVGPLAGEIPIPGLPGKTRSFNRVLRELYAMKDEDVPEAARKWVDDEVSPRSEERDPERLQQDTDRLRMLEDALDHTVIRVPAGDPSGTIQLKFSGFVDRTGKRVYLNGEDMQRLGGADTDGDTTFIYQGLPKGIRDAVRGRYFDNVTEDGRPIDMKEGFWETGNVEPRELRRIFGPILEEDTMGWNLTDRLEQVSQRDAVSPEDPDAVPYGSVARMWDPGFPRGRVGAGQRELGGGCRSSVRGVVWPSVPHVPHVQSDQPGDGRSAVRDGQPGPVGTAGGCQGVGDCGNGRQRTSAGSRTPGGGLRDPGGPVA